MFLFGVQRFLIMRGPEHAGKAELARAVADGLPGKTTLVRYADLAERWIVHHGEDVAAEAEMCYRLLKLIAMTHLKAGYNVVLDAPYVDTEPGAAERVREVDDLVRLARSFRVVHPTVVTFAPDGAAGDGVSAGAHFDAASDDEIRVEGHGGDIERFAAELLDRIGTM